MWSENKFFQCLNNTGILFSISSIQPYQSQNSNILFLSDPETKKAAKYRTWSMWIYYNYSRSRCDPAGQHEPGTQLMLQVISSLLYLVILWELISFPAHNKPRALIENSVKNRPSRTWLDNALYLAHDAYYSMNNVAALMCPKFIQW
jgi:hypothetical protein